MLSILMLSIFHAILLEPEVRAVSPCSGLATREPAPFDDA
jgi:hypothetical protein